MLISEFIKEECKGYDYQVVFESQQVNVLYINTKYTLICQITADINLLKFKEELLHLLQIVQKLKVRQLVIDRRNMFTLHFPSLEWFYSVWLPHMIKLGVRTLHIILPENELFRFSLKLGKDKILKKNPELSHQSFSPHFHKTLQEALQNF